jgi:predicted AlkP superfamily phosphohydrolase/phosphomutase
MEANTNRGELLPEMLRLILAEPRADETGPFRLLSSLRELIPRSWRNLVKDRLPRGLQDRLTGFWRTGGKDWSHTKAFALVPDLQGFIRINLRGREARGVVGPGAEYDALCARIIAGLMQFVDADSGQALVREATTMRALFPAAASLDHLPDIVVNWTKTPCASHRCIDSPFGSIRWPTPGRNFDGRSGNHSARGFLLLAGAGVPPGTVLPDIDIVDLAPTLYRLFGLPKPAHMHGTSFLAD